MKQLTLNVIHTTASKLAPYVTVKVHALQNLGKLRLKDNGWSIPAVT